MKKVLLYLLMTLTLSSCDTDDMIQPSIEVNDEYGSEPLSFQITEQTSDFNETNPVCYITAPDGTIIKRECSHQRSGDVSTITMPAGLKDGEYRLLYFEYPLSEPMGENGEFKNDQFGLGFRISVSGGNVAILDSYNSTYDLSGSGTKEDPYHICTGKNLLSITAMAYNRETDGVYFVQDCDIDLGAASFMCSHANGWLPIGGDTNYPFSGYYDGCGYSVFNISCDRPNSAGIGLFGFIEGANIKGLTIKDSEFTGNFAVGAVVGVILSEGGTRNVSAIDSCVVTNCTVTGSENSVSVGGILGGIDVSARGNIYNCSVDASTTISSDYNAGGIVGASGLHSTTLINRCKNAANITSKYAGAGGIIAMADTLCVTTSHNTGTITSNKAEGTLTRGTGGICGGAGISSFTGCTNTGEVSGKDGVGGILGSTRLGADDEGALILNNTYLRYCKNSANISGTDCVAGLCGEAQFGCYGSLNTGDVSGMNYVGGVAGYTSIAVVSNTANSGQVNGNAYVAGIVSKSNMGAYSVCQNFNRVEGLGAHVAGIVGITANNTIIHYCSNFGEISGGADYTGGIVGEIGEQKEMSGLDIAECIVGSLEIVTSFIGPTFAFVEDLANGAKAVKTVLKVSEIGIESIMKSLSGTLFAFTVDELCNPEELEIQEYDISQDLTKCETTIMSDLQNLRSNASAKSSTFSTEPILTYGKAINNLSSWLDTGSDETNSNLSIFNNNINEFRNEIAEEVEELNEAREMFFAIASGITLVTTTTLEIVASVASGGTAALLCAGTFVGIAGGTLSIVKGCTNYPENVIAVTQCVNTGAVSSSVGSDLTGGIGGRISHRAKVLDCLNIGDGNGDGGQIAGYLGNKSELLRCIAIAEANTWDDICENYGNSIHMLATYCNDNGYYSRGYGRPASDIGDNTHYKGWQIDEDDVLWTIPTVSSGYTFPVPYNSDMK